MQFMEKSSLFVTEGTAKDKRARNKDKHRSEACGTFLWTLG